MALQIADRVRERTLTTGTGTIDLAGPLALYQSFVDGIGDGNTCHYVIECATGWETGLGTVTAGSPDTLSRDVVIASSNSGSKISIPAGTAVVSCTLPGNQAAARAALSVREKLTADRTYYVATDGDDSNDGLSVAAPFATIQKAIDVVFGDLDLAGYDVIIQLADGTYTAGASVSAAQVGAGGIFIRGNTSSPDNVILDAPGAALIFTSGYGTKLFVGGMKLQTTTSGNCLYATAGSEIALDYPVNFGACTDMHIRSDRGAIVQSFTDYTISGSADRHWSATDGGLIRVSSRTITITGTPAFSPRFATSSRLSNIFCSGNTFTGAATGNRYFSESNSVIFTGGAGSGYLPGTGTEVVATGGLYI